MPTLKKHIQAWAVESTNLYDSASSPSTSGSGTHVDTMPYKNVSGTSYTSIHWYENNVSECWRNATQAGLVPVATADVLADYSINDYSVSNSVGTVSYSTNRVAQADRVTLTYNVTVSNNGDSDIDVTCIRFKKNIRCSTSLSDVLMYSYYLDSAQTIASGDSYTFAITLQIIAIDE